MKDVFIQIEGTPNPLTRKFSFGIHLTDTPYEVSAQEGGPDALASLLQTGVASIFVGRDYLSLTVADEAAWPDVQALARQAITDGAEELGSLSRSETIEASTDPVVTRIMELLDTHIRPAVAHDGGDVRFHSFDGNGVLHLEMVGACAGCPSSTATLKLGIRNMMRHFVPEVQDVEAVAR
jgi:Fe-S cluster biogenesis protein NfuA